MLLRTGRIRLESPRSAKEFKCEQFESSIKADRDGCVRLKGNLFARDLRRCLSVGLDGNDLAMPKLKDKPAEVGKNRIRLAVAVAINAPALAAG
jgi:hypothetical protein